MSKIVITLAGDTTTEEAFALFTEVMETIKKSKHCWTLIDASIKGGF